MTLYFFESTALAKLFIAELGSDRLIALIEPLTAAQKLVSALRAVEVHSAIRRREREGDLSHNDADQALSILTAESASMTEQPINTPVIETAKQMLDRHRLRSLDAIQLASGWVARATAGVTDVVFVASDQPFCRRPRLRGSRSGTRKTEKDVPPLLCAPAAVLRVSLPRRKDRQKTQKPDLSPFVAMQSPPGTQTPD